MSLLGIRDLRTEIHGKNGMTIAVDGVSLDVDKGETVGIVGESGCGKSSIALSIMNLLPAGGRIATESSITLDGRELVGLPDKVMRQVRGSGIAMVFQDPMTSLNPTMTIGNQIAEAVRIHTRASAHDCRERAVEALDSVGMPQPRERLGYYPHQLSGGLRQRVMIALAISCRPQVLIADEPTTALDVTTESKILDVLGRLKDEFGMALVLISHDLGLIAERAERVYVMYGGRLVETAAASTVFSNVRHPYTSALLGSIPRGARKEAGQLAIIPGRPPTQRQSELRCLFAPRCPRVAEDCKQRRPELEPVAAGHSVACFHPLGESAPAASSVRSSERVVGPAIRDGADGETAVTVLNANRLSKRYSASGGAFRSRKGSVSAVDDVTLAVYEGEVFGLMGESGCGKSTLARVLVGLEQTSSGTVSMGGDDIAGAFRRSRRGRRERVRLSRRLQLMFQDPYSSLDPRMNVRDILREPLVAQGLGTRREREQRIREILDEVGLPNTASNLYPHEFSGGQRQRIGLARSLIVRPEVLIADEPVSALDVSVQAQVLNLMSELQARHRLTYIIVSHDQRVIRYMADRVAVMYLGRLVEFGPTEAVYKEPAHPYTAALIEAGSRDDLDRSSARPSVAMRGEMPSAINPPSGCRYRTRCPLAQDVCALERPAMVEIGPGHFVECHFPLLMPGRDPLPSHTAEALTI